MRKKRLIVFILTAAFASLLLAGCQAEEAAESRDVQTETRGDAAAETEDAVYGNVGAIDGNVITLELGTLNDDLQMRGQNGQGEPPSGENRDGEKPADMPSDMPAPENQPSDMPSGEQPADRPSDRESPSILTLTGESIAITVNDETIIASLGGEDGTDGLASIEVGATLKIIYADDGESVESITVMGGMGGFSGGRGEPSGKAPASS
jgi:hypothetical protein